MQEETALYARWKIDFGHSVHSQKILDGRFYLYKCPVGSLGIIVTPWSEPSRYLCINRGFLVYLDRGQGRPAWADVDGSCIVLVCKLWASLWYSITGSQCVILKHFLLFFKYACVKREQSSWKWKKRKTNSNLPAPGAKNPNIEKVDKKRIIKRFIYILT